MQSIDSKTSINSLDDASDIEDQLFTCINQSDKLELQKLLADEESADSIYKILLTKIYHNEDNVYSYDEETLQEAHELLGNSVKSLNMLQVCCMLGDEELAMEILEFIQRITDELESKKLLLEFVGRLWGDGNTVLHLAAFMGMDQLVVRLIELGANTNKKNIRQYRPVDCGADEVMCNAFNTIPLDGNVTRRISTVAREEEEEAQKATKSVENLVKSIPDDVNLRSTKDSAERVEALATRRRRSRSVCSIDEMKKKSANLLSTNALGASILFEKHKRTPSNTKHVGFDSMSLILYICQYGDGEDELNLTSLRKATENRELLFKLKTGHQRLTPLHLACAYDQIKVVRYLLSECGVEVNDVDKEGWTPLHSACVEGHTEIVELLGRCQGVLGHETNDHPDWFFVKDGPINLCPTNEDGETPEMLATDKKLDNIVAMMQNLYREYPPVYVPSRVASEYDSEEGTENDSRSETESVDDDSILVKGLLVRQKSTSAPKAALERRNLKTDPQSSSSDSVDDITSPVVWTTNPVAIQILNDIKTKPIQSTITSEIQPIMKPKKVTVSYLSSDNSSVLPKNAHSPSTANIIIPPINAARLENDIVKKLVTKEARSKRLSASRDSLKTLEKKVTVLNISSPTKESHRLSDLSTLPQAIEPIMEENETKTSQILLDESLLSDSLEIKSVVPTFNPNLFVERTSPIITKRVPKEEQKAKRLSFTKDMEIPKMQGKYTSSVTDSRLGSSPTPETKSPIAVGSYSQRQAILKEQAAILKSPSIPVVPEIKISQPIEKASSTIFSKTQAVETVGPLPLTAKRNSQSLLSASKGSQSSLIGSSKIKQSTDSISNSVRSLASSLANVMGIKDEKKSRIPTPVKSSTERIESSLVRGKLGSNSLLSQSQVSPSKSPNERQIVNPAAEEDDSITRKFSIMDRIRNYEKQTKK